MNLTGLIALSALLSFAATGVAANTQNAVGAQPVPSVSIADANAQDESWGIDVVAIRLTAADYMLDFRYRFSDFEKASEVVNRKTRPYLIVERNGAKLHVPVSQKLGPLRQAQNHMKPNRTYFMFFANPGRMVSRGDKVTLVMGDFQKQHIVVE